MTATERRSAHLMANYRRQAIALESGNGVMVRDSDGRDYIDLAGGIAVNVLGHAHPDLVAAIADQAGKLIHTSNLYTAPLQQQLADAIVRTAFDGSVFFCNSGTEANEAAIKIARKWGRRTSPERTTIIAFEGGFHGRTLGALAATAEPRYRAPFEPLPAGFVHVPYGDIAALRGAIGTTTAAVIVEVIQGEAGVVPLPDGVLPQLRALCDEHGLLLIIDEIHTGIGRTGEWWAHQREGVVPDVMTIAKGLGGGVPIGAVLVRHEADVLEPGDHGSTFGGNPLAMRAALTVIDVIERDGLRANARLVGELIAREFESSPSVVEVRGAGLMRGVVLREPIATDVAARAADAGVLVIPVGNNVLRLLPPLIITDDEAREGCARVLGAIIATEEAAHANA